MRYASPILASKQDGSSLCVGVALFKLGGPVAINTDCLCSEYCHFCLYFTSSLDTLVLIGTIYKHPMTIRGNQSLIL